MILVAVMLFGFVVKAQPSKVDKPTEWKPNTTVLVSANQQYKLSYQAMVIWLCTIKATNQSGILKQMVKHPID